MNFQIKSFDEYKKTYQYSVENPQAFWNEIATHFQWKKPWNSVLEWDTQAAGY